MTTSHDCVPTGFQVHTPLRRMHTQKELHQHCAANRPNVRSVCEPLYVVCPVEPYRYESC